MKFLHYAALFMPAVMAMEEAMSADVIKKAGDIQSLVEKHCTDLPKECSGGLSGLLDSIKGTGAGDQKEGMKGALGTFAGELQKDPECITKVKSCFGKVRQDLGAALHKPAPTGAM